MITGLLAEKGGIAKGQVWAFKTD